MKKKFLALSLAITMLLTMLVPSGIVSAEPVTGDAPSVGTGVAVTVDWSRSSEINEFINPVTVYNDQDAANEQLELQDDCEVRLIGIDRNESNPYDGKFTWDFLGSLGHSVTDNVWDAQENRTKYFDNVINGGLPSDRYDQYDNRYYDNKYEGKFTSFPAATWMHAISRAAEGYGVPSVRRFNGTFNVADAIPADQVLSNIYIGVDQSGSDNKLMMNDGMFVFVYPAVYADNLTDDPDSDFYFGNFLAYWASTPINSAETFLNKDKLGTAYDYNPASGNADHDFVDGWHIIVEDIPAYDVGEYSNETEWVVDIFAIEVDRGGGMAAPNVYVNWKETVDEYGIFSIQKMVEDEELGYAPGNGFIFNAYAEIDENGNPAGGIIGTATTNALGVASFESESFVPGTKYYVFEAMNVEQSLIYQFGAQNEKGYIEVVAKEKGEFDTAIDFYNDFIPSTGKLIIGKELGRKINVGGSITGGYPEEGTTARDKQKHNLDIKLGGKGNWFQFNEFSNRTGGTFDLVQGDSLKTVGEYTITANGNGSFTVTFNDLVEGIGAKLSISNTILAAKNKNDKAYNVNNIWASSPGQQQFSFSGNSFTFNAPWVDLSKTVYVYLHLDGLTGYADTHGATAGQTFKVEVTGPSYPNGYIIDVPMNDSIELSGLKPGKYVVKEIEYGWIATYFVDGDTDGITTRSVTVDVKNNENTTVKLKNEPGVYPYGVFAIQKMVQVDGEDGYLTGGMGFVFNAYAEIDKDGKPVGEIIATATTNIAGSAIFDNEDIEPDKTYYVFEDMTDEQSRIYMFGAQNEKGYIEVVALEKQEGVPGPEAIEFYNDLALGKLNVIDDVIEEYNEEYHRPVYETNALSGDTWVSLSDNKWNNKHTYVEINVEAAKAPEGITYEIAKNNTDFSIGYRYNVKIVDGRIIISFDENLISGDMVARAFAAVPSQTPPGSHTEIGLGSEYAALDGEGNNIGVFEVPAGADSVYLYVHFSAISFYTTDRNGDRIVSGCAHDKCEADSRPFAGNVTMTVTNAEGIEIYNGELGLVEDLIAGDYTVTIFAGEIVVKTAVLTVSPGVTTTADFGTLTVPDYFGEEVINCDYAGCEGCLCGGH